MAKFKNESEKHFSFVILKMTILLLAELLNFYFFLLLIIGNSFLKL